MDNKIVECPGCGSKEEVYGNGFYGSYECQCCGTWFNLWGQELIPPEEQVFCEDW